MHIEPVDLAGRRDIAQALQGWAQQGRAAVSLIEKAILRRQKHAILPEPGLQHGKLAGDGLRARLLFGRDTGVDGTAQRDHACCLLVIVPAAAARETDAPCRSGGGRSRRWGIGSKRSNAAAMTCASSRLASWLTRTTSEGGWASRRGIGASINQPSHLGRPTQLQRRTPKAVAIPCPELIP